MAVTDDDVKALVDTTRAVAPFLATAQLIVSEQLPVAPTMSQDRLDKITAYLAAHFVVITEESGGIVMERANLVQESYRQPASTLVGFESTRYGQQAILLDTSGKLRLMTKSGGLSAQFCVIGDPSDSGSIYAF